MGAWSGLLYVIPHLGSVIPWATDHATISGSCSQKSPRREDNEFGSSGAFWEGAGFDPPLYVGAGDGEFDGVIDAEDPPAGRAIGAKPVEKA